MSFFNYSKLVFFNGFVGISSFSSSSTHVCSALALLSVSGLFHVFIWLTWFLISESCDDMLNVCFVSGLLVACASLTVSYGISVFGRRLIFIGLNDGAGAFGSIYGGSYLDAS